MDNIRERWQEGREVSEVGESDGKEEAYVEGEAAGLSDLQFCFTHLKKHNAH